MKHRYLILSAYLAAVLASAPSFLLAATNSSLPAADNFAIPRVTDTVNDDSRAVLPKTFPNVFKNATSGAPLNDSVEMIHLQLILKPSALQTAEMETTIRNQHDPKSAQFHHWLTPAQFGSRFGVADSDMAAITGWLKSQGLKVNNVYPNKTQVDFSGTVAQIRQAFHTQENVYTVDKTSHFSNSSDISVPAALKDVVTGIMGLDDLLPKALAKNPKIARWDAERKGFVAKSGSAGKPKGQAVDFGLERGLAPNDMATIYGIRTIRANGVTGKGINIAVVENADMTPADWTNFVNTFNLAKFNGTFQQINPQPSAGVANCDDPGDNDALETVLDAEWATAIAPGANIWVASCQAGGDYNAAGGVYLAALNLINAASATSRPDIISVSYTISEFNIDSPSKTAFDLMWAQADAEGISVFVAAGDSGTSAAYPGGIISNANNNPAVDPNALASSPHDTVVGGSDFADVLQGTTSHYFSPNPSVVGGSALSYVPEIPWNQSCGNDVAAKVNGFKDALSFCKALNQIDYNGDYISSAGGGGGPSTIDAKPTWQRQVFNAAKDQSRDLPDVSLFAGSYGASTYVILCTAEYPCAPGPSASELVNGTSLSSPMFAGIQALIDQGLTKNGLPADQGNAAPTLYALAATEYGTASGPTPPSLAACNADNGIVGSSGCAFHNITSGSNSVQCQAPTPQNLSNCYFYGTYNNGTVQIGLTSALTTPTSYTSSNRAYQARPGWSFSSGLGSVNATNLLIAWRAFVGAIPAKTSNARITK